MTHARTLVEQIKDHMLTTADLEAVLEILDQNERSPAVQAIMVKLRWNIAAARNEVEYDPSPAQI
jgi:hypothetical protein